PRFPLSVLSGAFVATRLKPSTDGTAWILRLFNASSGPEKLSLSGDAFEAGRVFLSDLNENQGPRLSSPLEVPAFGILTLLIR
ncbi:MAG: glycosyl hydrolase-related protein, partial [Candidatus Aminicenantales bacterium]